MWTAESIGFAVLCSHGRGKKHCKCLQENLKMFTEMSFVATPKCYFCLGTLSLILRAPHLIFIFKFGSSHSHNNIKRCKVFLLFSENKSGPAAAATDSAETVAATDSAETDADTPTTEFDAGNGSVVKQAKLDCKALGLLTLWLFLHTKFICFSSIWNGTV